MDYQENQQDLSVEESSVVGIVKALKKDGKGLLLTSLEGVDVWYSNNYFKEDVSNLCKKGDKIKVILTSQGYLSEIKVEERALPELTAPVSSGSDGNGGLLPLRELGITASAIVSYAKDMVCQGAIKIEELTSTCLNMAETYKKTFEKLLE